MDAQTYHSERAKLIDIELRSSDQHDKAILTLTSGALGLSITFLDKIAGNPAPGTLRWVAASWTCFIICLCLIVGSFLTSQKACRRQLHLLDDEYSTGTIPGNLSNRWSIVTAWLTALSYVLFVLGVICLARFSWVNL